MWHSSRSWKIAPWALAAVTLLSSCGQKKFNRVDFTANAVAGQYIYIKPKLDLVVFQDYSDSMFNALGQVKPQLQSFLNSLDTNWEYRFIVLPLQRTQPLNQKYVVATDCTGINAASCLSPSQSGTFNSLGGDAGWINNRDSSNTIGNTDLGFQNMAANISSLSGSGFLRSDAALAMVVISNGEDVSGGVNYALRPDGSITSIDYNGAQTINSFNYYKSIFQGFKSSIALDKFYSVVAANRYGDCYGGGMTWAGVRYMNMASSLGGLSFDLCQGELPRVLDDIRGHLQTVVQTIIFNYVKLDSEPDPSTIVVRKNGVTLANSAANGWTYSGYLVNQPTSYSPTLGNYQTGYMIHLNGTAEFKGSDQISIDFQKK